MADLSNGELDPQPFRIQPGETLREAMVVAEFYDPRGYPIQTTTKRTMTFTPISSTVRLLTMRVDIEPGGSSATVFVFPAGLGRAELNVSTPHVHERVGGTQCNRPSSKS